METGSSYDGNSIFEDGKEKEEESDSEENSLDTLSIIQSHKVSFSQCNHPSILCKTTLFCNLRVCGGGSVIVSSIRSEPYSDPLGMFPSEQLLYSLLTQNALAQYPLDYRAKDFLGFGFALNPL